ncbi:hypothetical protein [Micromonospora sp. NBS 11-29]|uniref:hypothetical protein n=1 Tax=Micromonospora sp. NBS 11-29 TaxID=1960879 RepID=UPI000B780C66|nr:hypothetical protein [Micromonospora sp. NBS 11-29]
MPDDVTLVEALHRDLRNVRWAEPAEIRAAGRRRSRRTTTLIAVSLVVVAALGATLVDRTGAPTPAPPAAGPEGRAEISVAAMLTATDVPAATDERLGDTGLGERVRVDDILQACAREQGLPADQLTSRYSRSQTLIGAVEVPGFASYRRPFVSQDVYRLETGGAERLFADLDRSVTACADWRRSIQAQGDQGVVDMTVGHRWTVLARAFAGDQAILLRHTVSEAVEPTVGEPVVTPARPEDRLVVRVGDLVTVVVPGEPLQPDAPGTTMTQAKLLDLARAAANRLCVAANPGC